MNRIGGKSNSGEGGEDPKRFQKRINGDSKIAPLSKASTFWRSINYLTSAKRFK
jgi:glutamate synthase (ferredoxin)